MRKVQFSPHQATVLASASYDMTMRLWDYGRAAAQLRVFNHHTEFAVDVDFSLLEQGLLASTGWDQTVHLLRV